MPKALDVVVMAGPWRLELYGGHPWRGAQRYGNRDLDRRGRCDDHRPEAGEKGIPASRDDFRGSHGNVTLRGQGHLPAHLATSIPQKDPFEDTKQVQPEIHWDIDPRKCQQGRLCGERHFFNPRHFAYQLPGQRHGGHAGRVVAVVRGVGQP